MTVVMRSVESGYAYRRHPGANERWWEPVATFFFVVVGVGLIVGSEGGISARLVSSSIVWAISMTAVTALTILRSSCQAALQ